MHGSPGPERLARYRWAARVIDGGRVLDAGCGTGWGTASLARVATRAVGVDYSPPAILEARETHGQVAEFHDGDLRSLPFEDGAFDDVVCFETLGHVAEVDKVLDELRRVLRPGGLLLISSANRRVYPTGNPLHLRERTTGEFERELSSRFAHVAIYGQQTYFASLLASMEMLALADPSTPIEAEVSKLSGDPPGTEVHAVAAASDVELPPPPPHLALGEDVRYEEQARELREWRERAVEAEAALLAARRELRRERQR
ncbi:MAG: class I SAM-dependent methyltransferase [Solirubrobacterales bacterium]